MSTAFFIQALGMIPLFASRAFLPAFLMSFMLTYPDVMPFVEPTGVVSGSFAAQPIVVWTLFVLAVLEIAADKNTDLKSIFIGFEPYAKMLIYFLSTAQLIDETSIGILKNIHRAGFFGEYTGTVLMSCCVFVLTWLKGQIEEFLLDIDEDGDLFLHTTASSFQDLFAFFGFFILMFFGIFALIFFAIFAIILFILQRKISSKEEKQKISCVSCGHKNPPFAVFCAKCGHESQKIYQIGILGQKKEAEVFDKNQHAYHLLTQKRCPICGNKADNSKKCRHCQNDILSRDEERKKYLAQTEKRFIPTVLTAFFMGFIPVLGICSAVIFANLYLNAPLRRHIPKGKTIAVKIIIRFFLLIFLFFGSVFGFILAPLYVILRFILWRKAFLSTLAQKT